MLRRPATRASGATARRDRAEWDLPDLFVVDGGKGQLAVALAAARDLGLHELPIVALAKEKENVLGETMVDRVYLPGQKNPIPLKSHSASMFFLARARDEAHRFSNRARERLGKKKRFKSALDSVAGLGPSTRKALLRTLGSLKAIQAATRRSTARGARRDGASREGASQGVSTSDVTAARACGHSIGMSRITLARGLCTSLALARDRRPRRLSSSRRRGRGAHDEDLVRQRRAAAGDRQGRRDRHGGQLVIHGRQAAHPRRRRSGSRARSRAAALRRQEDARAHRRRSPIR